MSLSEESLNADIIDSGKAIKAEKQCPDGKPTLWTTVSRERSEILAREKGGMIQVTGMDKYERDSLPTGTQAELIILVERLLIS